VARVLIADDIENNRIVLSRRIAGMGHEFQTANDGLEALHALQSSAFDALLLDIQMPRMDGYEVLENIKKNPDLRHIPVIVISAIDDMESIVRCIELGADDYLCKPFNSVLLKARVSSSLERKKLHDQEIEHRDYIEKYNIKLEDRILDQMDKIVSAQHSAIFAMAKLAESKDPETGAHLERMREYCRLLAQRLQNNTEFSNIVDDEFINNIYAASPLHDIGKVGVPDDILLKPAKLTDTEWVSMKTHTLIGSNTLREVDKNHPGNNFLKIGIEIAESHHEKWDGSGYPYGLSGEAIPISARILALGDVYDALTSKRCYKDAFSHDKSTSIILEGKGKHFDPHVVDAFLEIQDDFIDVRSRIYDEDE